MVLIKSDELKACGAYIACREEQQLVSFLMALSSDFEGLRGLILYHSPLPSIDSIVSELLAKEIRLKSHSEKGILFTSNPFVLVVLFKRPLNSHNKTYTWVAFDECSFCKKKGHWKAQCPKLRKHNQSQQQFQIWKPRNQTQSYASRPPRGYKPP